MKLRIFLLLSLILHVSIFLGIHQALWQFLHSDEVHDLTIIEISETARSLAKPVKASAKGKTPVPQQNLPTELAKSPAENLSTKAGNNLFDAVSVGAVTEAPKVIQEKQIAYPERARRAGVEGVVELKLVVNREGVVSEAEVSKGLGFGLDEAALSAIKEFKFTPARRGSDAISARIIYKYRFQLNR